MLTTGGSVFPFSQLSTVQELTPRRSAASSCVRRSSCLFRATCSPSVRGSLAKAPGFNALRLTWTNGKKATRPCPCGYHGDARGRCRCTPDQILRYRSKLSAPLLDRIDLQIEVPAVPADVLQQAPDGEASAAVRTRVTTARTRQIDRQGKPNARLEAREIDQHCQPQAAAAALLKQAIARLGLSARAFHRLLKVARTIADLAGHHTIEPQHVAEAVQYRRFAKD